MGLGYKTAIYALLIMTIVSFAGYLNAAGFKVPANYKADFKTSSFSLPGDITNEGTLQASTGSIKLDGSWTNTGTFNGGTSGTVEFTGSTASTITGANTFTNFTCTQAGKQLSFEAGNTQTISGMWTLTGVSGNLVALKSTVSGTQWIVNPATSNISFVDVKDSKNLSNIVMDPSNSTDSGNNTNWFSGVAVTTTTLPGATTTTTTSTTSTITTTTTTIVGGTAPVASFIVDRATDKVPFDAKFTDTSANNPTEWLWDFGDNSSSVEQNPTHGYTIEGIYSVTLTVENEFGKDSVTKEALIDALASSGKSFTFNCDHSMKRGFFGLETLTMNVDDTENCTLKLTNHEVGKTIEVSTQITNWFWSGIKIEPARSVTDENGELAITITAKRKGKDWAAWAVPNDRGRFLFNMKSYDTGVAWGMFVEVK